MKNIGEAMYSLNKKKSKLSPAQKHSYKIYHSRNKSKTQNSPNANRSLSKDQIKSTIKNYVSQQNAASKINKLTCIKQEPKKSKKIKSRLQISIPNIRSSLTPKSFKNYQAPRNDRQVHSTKAGDNNKMFTNSGRYDLKQLFDCKNQSYIKESGRTPHNSGNKISRQQSRIQEKKYQQATIKFNRDDDFDVRSVLTSQEYEKFGDRFPQKFKRIGLLGRGGFSVVWLGIHKSSKKKIAVKQILTKNPHQTHLKQIWFGSYFFEKGGQPREQFENHIGINNVCKLYSHQIRTIDSWLYYELCEQSLGACLFDLKGQTKNGERNYKIFYKQLVYKMRQNIEQLKILIIQIAKALHLINSHNIVHSDLKTQNILLKIKRKDQLNSNPSIKALKLIDFGSSFLFTNLKHFSMATPQYMPPQILNYILFQNKLQYDALMLNKMQQYKNPWIIDVWSLGCIVLQIVSGVPLWMSIPTKIDQSEQRAVGLFAVKGRLFNKIIQKQIEVVENIDFYLEKNNYSGIKLDFKTKQILKMMLELKPQKRVSPYQILTHFGVHCQPQRIPFY